MKMEYMSCPEAVRNCNMGKVLLVEDNISAVKKIVRYIGNISADLEIHSVSEAGEATKLIRAERSVICKLPSGICVRHKRSSNSRNCR